MCILCSLSSSLSLHISPDILSDITYQRVSLDLLGDRDIQNMLKKSYSLEDVTIANDEWDDETTEESDSGTEHEVISYRSLDACDKETDKDSDKENDRTYENRISSQDTLVCIISHLLLFTSVYYQEALLECYFHCC